jgi:LysR family transcriptional regulator of abg operon
MTLQQLRGFLAIVEYGSFRRAAKELGLSQAGLTNSLQALEASLGVRLMSRSAQGVNLTTQGKRLLDRAHLIDQEARRALDEAKAESGIVSGTLSVGLGPTTTALLLHLVVPEFHAKYPAVKLKLVSGFYEQLLPALHQGLIEVAITALPNTKPESGIKSKVLFNSDLVVVCRAGHPMAGAKFLSELKNFEWILLGSPGAPGGTIVRFHHDNELPPPKIAATCDNLTQLATLILGTDWLALIPSALYSSGLLGDRLISIKLSENAPRFNNSLIYRTEPNLTPAAAAFSKLCESSAKGIKSNI